MTGMSIAWVRECCLSFPHATESIQWETHILFKIGGKMFCVANPEPVGNFLSLKADPEAFPELIERPGVIPAPYMARNKWVALETEDALPRAEVRTLLRQSYDLVRAKLSKKLQKELGGQLP
jgi:predicted DNA-binding protein (MmcQ/YjbR family)